MDLLPCVEMPCRYGGDAVCRTLNRAGFKIGARQIFFVCHVTGLEGEPDVVRNTRTDGRSKEFQQEFRNKIADCPAQQQALRDKLEQAVKANAAPVLRQRALPTRDRVAIRSIQLGPRWYDRLWKLLNLMKKRCVRK